MQFLLKFWHKVAENREKDDFLANLKFSLWAKNFIFHGMFLDDD
jgi:abortive infection bacteriophage resistance protein